MKPGEPGRTGAILAALLLLMALLSCSGRRPADLGPQAGQLAPCPASPNCVSSDATDTTHRVAPLQLAVPVDRAWNEVQDAVAALPRTTVVTRTDDYLHAECRSALLGFVDDLELVLRQGEVALRSASRLGYSDLGVNRRRVKRLRAALRARGVVR